MDVKLEQEDVNLAMQQLQYKSDVPIKDEPRNEKIKQEDGLEHKGKYQDCLVSLVKMERDKVELYKNHVIKEELELGPEELLQPKLETGSSVDIDVGCGCVQTTGGRKPSCTAPESGCAGDWHHHSYNTSFTSGSHLNLRMQWRTNTTEISYTCDICCQRSITETHLKHIQRHNDSCFHCSICGSKWLNNRLLMKHLLVHTRKNRLNCNNCGSYKPYCCKICNKKFARTSDLTVHMRTHTGEKAHCCNICNKRFSLKYNLTVHMRTHTGETSYCCNICNAKFNQNRNLTLHMRTHTGDKPYCCKYCKKKFSSSGNLTVHMRGHTGEKTYFCNICDRKFAERYSLTVHMRSHAGEKPFSCHICEKKFARSTHLAEHMRIHTGDKPFCCEICNKKFNKKCNLAVHKRTHFKKTLL